MSNLCRNTGVTGWIIAGFLTIMPGISNAATNFSCGERGASYRLISNSTGTVTIDVSQFNYVSWVATAGSNQVEIDYGEGFAVASAPGSFDVPKTVTLFKIKTIGSDSEAAVSCASISLDSDTKTPLTVGDIAASSQTQATNSGIGTNSKSRFGVGKNFISKNKVFVSTSNMNSSRFLPADWNAWGTIEGRSYSGGLEGLSLDFVGGVDKLIAENTLAGVLIGYGRTNLTDAGTPQATSSPMIGLYLGQNINDTLIFDGFLSVARPDYSISGANFSSQRVAAGMTLTGRIKRPKMLLEPFLFARGYQEEQPGYTTGLGAVVASNSATSFSASLGVRVNFADATKVQKLVPYVSAAADYRVTTSTINPGDQVLAPRIAFGVTGALGKGQVSLDIDFGKTRSDTFDRGIKFGYEMKF